MRYHIILDESADGVSVCVQELPGCCTQGETWSEALDNIQVAATEWLAVSGETTVPAVRPSPAIDIEFDLEREHDSRWLAEAPRMPGVIAYGDSPEAAVARAEVLALRVLAEQIENGEINATNIFVNIH